MTSQNRTKLKFNALKFDNVRTHATSEATAPVIPEKGETQKRTREKYKPREIISSDSANSRKEAFYCASAPPCANKYPFFSFVYVTWVTRCRLLGDAYTLRVPIVRYSASRHGTKSLRTLISQLL